MEITNLNSKTVLKDPGDNYSMEKVNLFNEIHQHLMEDKKPSDFLNSLSNNHIFQDVPFSMLLRLKKTEQSTVHHPEGNVWNHTMLVVEEAAKVKEDSRNPEAFMWSALLHDLGKPDTTRKRKGKITAYDHDKVGAELTKRFLAYFPCEEEFVNHVVSLVRYHMHILYVTKDLPFAKAKEMMNHIDVNEIALFVLCDRLGRKNADKNKEEETIQLFLTKLKGLKGMVK
jgi:putative nucleotidyltransferase with HDIG domain